MWRLEQASFIESEGSVGDDERDRALSRLGGSKEDFEVGFAFPAVRSVRAGPPISDLHFLEASILFWPRCELVGSPFLGLGIERDSQESALRREFSSWHISSNPFCCFKPTKAIFVFNTTEKFLRPRDRTVVKVVLSCSRHAKFVGF
jgi:hypothetical protein